MFLNPAKDAANAAQNTVREQTNRFLIFAFNSLINGYALAHIVVIILAVTTTPYVLPRTAFFAAKSTSGAILLSDALTFAIIKHINVERIAPHAKQKTFFAFLSNFLTNRTKYPPNLRCLTKRKTTS